MNIIEIILIACGLAMDAFAVSLSAGTSGRVRNARATLRLSFHLGLFQFMMPIIGWYMGTRVEPVISSFDHWIAFGLLFFIGCKMIYESYNRVDSSEKSDPSKGANLIFLSIATSIDALAIGLSLAMLNVEIWYPSVIIGIITGILSFLAIKLGRLIGERIGKSMEVIGGTLLLIIGLRILVVNLL